MKWLPTPVLLPGKFHGQRSLEGYSPWGCKESDLTERLTLSLQLITSSIVLTTGKSFIYEFYDVLSKLFLIHKTE